MRTSRCSNNSRANSVQIYVRALCSISLFASIRALRIFIVKRVNTLELDLITHNSNRTEHIFVLAWLGVFHIIGIRLSYATCVIIIAGWWWCTHSARTTTASHTNCFDTHFCGTSWIFNLEPRHVIPHWWKSFQWDWEPFETQFPKTFTAQICAYKRIFATLYSNSATTPTPSSIHPSITTTIIRIPWISSWHCTVQYCSLLPSNI